jgi:CRISPR-associated protein Csb2
MIALRLELLTGRYVASEFNNRNRPEWPPHPARVYSALVAAYYEGGRPSGGDAALRWLESLDPPQITFSKGNERDLKINYVPVNDKAISDASMVDTAWAKVAAAGTDAKQLAKAEKQLTTAYAKVAAPDKKLSKNFHAVAAHILPATRTKQPRTFPSVTPDDPVVYLAWEDTPAHEIRAGLEALARALVRIGHSSSLVTATWVSEAPAPTWVPDARGPEVLRWVSRGQLAALDSLHDGSPFAEQRVMPYTVARYREARPLVAVHSSCFSSKFVVLRRVEGPRVPILATESIADAVRRALMSHADDPTPSLITGHGPGGVPADHDHLAVLPLANVGNAHAQGEVLGVALVAPTGLELAELQPLYSAIGRWEAASGVASDEPRAVLKLGALGVWVLERSLEISPLHNLREATWVRKSTSWASVTPMVLDRHPGSMKTNRDAAVRRMNATITAACRRIGLPAPVEIELSVAPFFKGSEDAKRFRRRNGTTDRRPLIHARLRFDEPVVGPVLLGAGRYRGLGLFRPYGEQS